MHGATGAEWEIWRILNPLGEQTGRVGALDRLRSGLGGRQGGVRREAAVQRSERRAARVLTRGTNLSISPQPSVRLPWVPGRAAVQRNRRSRVGGVAQGRIRLWVSTRCVGRQYAAN